MSSNYSNNSYAQTICHYIASPLLKVASELCSSNNTTINIALFGCGPGDNDLNAFKKYMFPILNTRFPNHIIQLFMIDIVKTKWGTSTHKIANNIYVTGIISNLYEKLFPENTLDIILSFSCLHWFDILPDTIITSNKFCWSLLDTDNKTIIKKIINNNLNKFLTIRSKELKSKGQLIITCDGDIPGQCHHFQRPSECVSNILETFKKYWTNPTIFSKFFILTAPYTKEDVCSIVNTIPNISIDNIYTVTVHCPFLENYNNDISNGITQLEAKSKYTNSISSSIMACISPSLRTKIPNCNEYLINKINNSLFNSVLKNPAKLSQTQGNVMLIHCYKQ